MLLKCETTNVSLPEERFVTEMRSFSSCGQFVRVRNMCEKILHVSSDWNGRSVDYQSEEVLSLSWSDYSLSSAELSGFASPSGPPLGSMAAWQQHQLGSLG